MVDKFILALSRLIDTAYLCYVSTIPICLAWSEALLRPLDLIFVVQIRTQLYDAWFALA